MFSTSAVFVLLAVILSAFISWLTRLGIVPLLAENAGVLVVQIPVERVFGKVGFPEMNYVVGFLFTGCRVWQLWCYETFVLKEKERDGYKRKFVLGMFAAGFVFWLLNELCLTVDIVARAVGS